jgi:hypothetical protein
MSDNENNHDFPVRTLADYSRAINSNTHPYAVQMHKDMKAISAQLHKAGWKGGDTTNFLPVLAKSFSAEDIK